MKSIKYSTIIAVGLLALFSACQDDNILPRVPQTGNYVNFTVSTSDEIKSRTWYGKPIDASGNVLEIDDDGNAPEGSQIYAWPINWNTEDMGYDQIFIYAPNAMAGRETGTYQVENTKSNETNTTTPSTIVMIGESGVQWGEEATKFYGIYPASLAPTFKGSTITAVLPAEQDANTTGIESKLLTGDKANSAVTYRIAGDMTSCIMTAATEAIEPTTTEAINLTFNPISTCLNIYVTGPNANTKSPVHVTSVQISSNAQICGSFTYDFDTNAITLNPSETNPQADKIIDISTLYLDNLNVRRGIPLNNNSQKLNLQTFILPNDAIEWLKVSIFTAEGYNWTKTLTLTNSSGTEIFKSGQINQVTLPAIDVTAAKLDFSKWLSQLDPRIYISDLSLPGTAMSFINPKTMRSTNSTSWGRTTLSLDTESSSDVIQNASLAEQFQAGIRVFQAHVWMDGEVSDIDGDAGRIIIVGPNGNPVYKDKSNNVNDPASRFTLYDALKILQEEMVNNHGDEFCVLMLSDYNVDRTGYTNTGIKEGKTVPTATGGTKQEAYNLEDLYDKLTVVTKYLANPARGQGQMLPDKDITPETTIYDVRDKIILKFQINGDCSFSAPSAVNQTLTKFQWLGKTTTGGDGLNGSEALYNIFTSAADNTAMYSPMFYGSNDNALGTENIWGQFTFTECKNTYHILGQEVDTWPSRDENLQSPAITGGSGITYNLATHFVAGFNANNPSSSSGLVYDAKFYNDNKGNTTAYPLWYIYGEQANPGDNSSKYTGAFNNITHVTDAILATYDVNAGPNVADNHYYMTYLGGQGGSSYDFTTITNNFNVEYYGTAAAPAPSNSQLGRLLTKEGVSIKVENDIPQYDETSAAKYVSLGWVMVNNLTLSDVINPATENLTARIVQAVIQNNGQQKLLLHRAASVGGTTPATPASQSVSQQGGTTPIHSGESLLVRPRRK